MMQTRGTGLRNNTDLHHHLDECSTCQSAFDNFQVTPPSYIHKHSQGLIFLHLNTHSLNCNVLLAHQVTSRESAITWWSRRPSPPEYCSARELQLLQGLGKCMFNNHDKQDELAQRHHTLFRFARGEFPHADGTFAVNACYNFSARNTTPHEV